MPRFRVKLDGFRFQKKDPITEAVNLAESDDVEADGPEMAQIEFMKKWGINSTTRPFKIHQILEASEQATPATATAATATEPDPKDDLDLMVAEARDVEEPEPVLATATPVPTPEALGPEITLQPAPVLTSPAPVPLEQPTSAPAHGKRGKGKRASLVGDPDGVMDEIRKL